MGERQLFYVLSGEGGSAEADQKGNFVITKIKVVIRTSFEIACQHTVRRSPWKENPVNEEQKEAIKEQEWRKAERKRARRWRTEHINVENELFQDKYSKRFVHQTVIYSYRAKITWVRRFSSPAVRWIHAPTSSSAPSSSLPILSRACGA